jgi:hypothetical protein
VEIQNQDFHFPTAPISLRRKEEITSKNDKSKSHLHKTLDTAGRKHPRSFTVPANLGERFVMASTSSHGQHLRARRASRESSSLFSCVSGTMVDTVYALESGVLSSFLMEGLLSSS